jgi:hypothetical protein
MSQSSLFSSRVSRGIALVLLFVTALSIRLYDLTDPPLDFHPTRQLLSAIKARALYYETQPDGISTEQLEAGIYLARLKATVEPVFFERLVAFTYRYTGEQLWVARVYSSLFWLIGGIFLFLLVRELTSFEGALFSTAYYLLFPYAIISSRSFQPDILMVMLIVSFWWMFARWMDLTPSPSPERRGGWINALLAGLWGGLAIYIKFSAAFFVIGAALGLALSRYTLRELLRNAQVWAMAILGALPALTYLIYGIFVQGTLGGQFAGRFIPALLLNPINYLQWAVKADMAAGGIFIALGLLGFFLTDKGPLRGLMAGMWISYAAYGLFFDYHIATHDYYHLPLIAIVAVSLSLLGSWFFAHLAESTVQGWQRGGVYVILLFALFINVWNVRNRMKDVDFRPQAAMFTELGKVLDDEKFIALTQDYGSRLEYWGWKSTFTWPYVGDLTYANVRGDDFSFDDLFEEYSSKKDLFLVTDFEELNRQPVLKERLNGYPVYMQGDGYLILDLRQP